MYMIKKNTDTDTYFCERCLKEFRSYDSAQNHVVECKNKLSNRHKEQVDLVVNDLWVR